MPTYSYITMKNKNIKLVYKKLGKEKIWGLADFGEHTIYIDSRIRGKKHIEILCHEAFHLLFPEIEEDEIIKKSIALTNLLWKAGVTVTERTNNIPLQDGSK